MLAPLAARYLLSDGPGRSACLAFLASPDGGGEVVRGRAGAQFSPGVARTAAFAQHPIAGNLIGLKAGPSQRRLARQSRRTRWRPLSVRCQRRAVPAALRARSPICSRADYSIPMCRRPPPAMRSHRPQRNGRCGCVAAPPFAVKIAPAAARGAGGRLRGGARYRRPARARRPLRPRVCSSMRSRSMGQAMPLPVMHSDEGFTLLLDTPAPEALERVSRRCCGRFQPD